MPEAEPDVYLEFVYTDEFVDSVTDVLSDDEMHALEDELLHEPEVGRLIPGTGGVRKMRFAPAGRGKSGGLRVLYLYVKHGQRIYLLLAYSKNVRETLTQGEKNALKAWVREL